MEENFSMEWNIERKIFSMEWKWNGMKLPVWNIVAVKLKIKLQVTFYLISKQKHKHKTNKQKKAHTQKR